MILDSHGFGPAQNTGGIVTPEFSLLNSRRSADAFEAATQAQSSAKEQSVGKRAAILAQVDTLMQRKRTIGYMIENVFDGDPEALAGWKSASHVEKPPKKKPTP